MPDEEYNRRYAKHCTEANDWMYGVTSAGVNVFNWRNLEENTILGPFAYCWNHFDEYTDPNATYEDLVGYSENIFNAASTLAIAKGGYTALKGKTGKLATVENSADRAVVRKGNVVDKVDDISEGVKAGEEMVTYRRVQGGTPPNASWTRITVDERGNIKIPNKRANLNVSTGNDEHAKYFLSKRGSNAEIVEFDIPTWLDDFLQENAINQKGYRKNPLNQGGAAQKIVDPTTPGNSYELPEPWIEWLEEYGKNGRRIK